MKTKILMSVLAIGLAIALIGGATMARFTDRVEMEPAVFTAGTVEIDVDGPFDGESDELQAFEANNVNPGDNYSVKWVIENAGTKKAELRVSLEEVWFIDEEDYAVSDARFERLKKEYGEEDIDGLEALLDVDETPIISFDEEKWALYKDDEGTWLYYIAGPVDAGNSVDLLLDVYFDPAETDNKYMGAKFKLGGFVDAIQASNGAPESEWDPAWSEVKEEEPPVEEPEEPEEP
jgi:predicted ribosomally synthesized peptide with SipW-like signal peptide